MWSEGSEVRLSIVVSMLNEEDVCPLFLSSVGQVLDEITDDYEIVCVNDGSRDGTLKILREAHRRDKRVKVIDLSRNFGKEAALTAGLEYSTGEAVIPIDADLQDPPELIPQMVEQ